MSNILSVFCESILAFLIFLNLGKAYLSKDKAQIWSPISAISLTYMYYVLWPFWLGTKERYMIDESMYNGHLFHFAALLSYVFIMVGFRKSTNSSFDDWNKIFDKSNIGKYGLVLWAVGIAGYSSVRGFHFSFAAEDNSNTYMAIGGFVYYFMMMLDMLPFASGLLFLKLKDNWKKIVYLIPFWFIFVQFLVAGARWRIVVAGFVLLTAHYLFPKIKKVNVPLLASIAFAVYIGFSVMDKARVRGGGIQMSVATELKYDDVKDGANENCDVYYFSVISMDKIYETDQRVYFQPFMTAIFMPIPRFMFPWKPDADYLHNLEDSVAAIGGGSAYLNFVESYFSFGWFGVIFWAWILGWLARKFWDNYVNNRESIGAIIALGVFSGFCYVTISRGYLPATFTTFIIAICCPFWISMLYRKIVKK